MFGVLKSFGWFCLSKNSEAAFCLIIELADFLTNADKKAMGEYLIELHKSELRNLNNYEV